MGVVFIFVFSRRSTYEISQGQYKIFFFYSHTIVNTINKRECRDDYAMSCQCETRGKCLCMYNVYIANGHPGQSIPLMFMCVCVCVLLYYGWHVLLPPVLLMPLLIAWHATVFCLLLFGVVVVTIIVSRKLAAGRLTNFHIILAHWLIWCVFSPVATLNANV